MSLSSPDRAVRLTAKTFQKLDRLFAVTGGVFPCSWEVFKAEMVNTYGMDAATLASLARLGHFDITPHSVIYRLGDQPKAVA